MNRRSIWAIMKKDWKEVRQNTGAWMPAVIVPIVLLVIYPALMILIPTQVQSIKDWINSPNGYAKITEYVGPFIGGRLDGFSPVRGFVVLLTGYMFAPFLLVMPLMLSTILGAESFVGERERKTLEALIYTPAKDSELFVGKVLASVIPAILLSWVSFLVYAVVVNTASWPAMHWIWFPPGLWWPLMLWLAPAIATLGMAVSVLISIRAKTFMEAYQLTGSLVVVVLLLVAGQISGVLFLSSGMILLVGLGVWAVDLLLIRIGIKTFSRPKLLERI
jgi:ABC-2 type transport system permease protein